MPKMTITEKKTYSYEVLVADDLEIIEKYNNAPHPDQKKYKDLSRMQVLEMYVNPQMAHIDRPLLFKFIGNKTATTIRRNQYVSVKQAKYGLTAPDVIAKLQPNNYEVEAYYLPNESNEIESIYLYQNEVFICKCDKIKTYNTANAEWASKDFEKYQTQAKYVAKFGQQVKDGKCELGKVKVMEKGDYYIDMHVDIIEEKVVQSNQTTDFEENQDNDLNRLNAINSL